MFQWEPFWQAFGEWLGRHMETLLRVYYFQDKTVTVRDWNNAFAEIHQWFSFTNFVLDHNRFLYKGSFPKCMELTFNRPKHFPYFDHQFVDIITTIIQPEFDETTVPKLVAIIPSDILFDKTHREKHFMCAVVFEWLIDDTDTLHHDFKIRRTGLSEMDMGPLEHAVEFLMPGLEKRVVRHAHRRVDTGEPVQTVPMERTRSDHDPDCPGLLCGQYAYICRVINLFVPCVCFE